LVAEGEKVEAGTVLARLDTAAIERNLASSRASLQSAEADSVRIKAQQNLDALDIESAIASSTDAVASAQQSLAESEKALAISQQLFALGAVSENEFKTAQEAVASAQRRLEQSQLSLESAQARRASFAQLAEAQRSSAQAQIAQLETSIANLEEQLDESELIALFAGTITDISFEAGDQVSQANQLTLVDTSSLYARVNFDENRAAELKVGQPATVTPDADSKQKLAATVRRVSSVASRSGNAAQVEAQLDFANPAKELLRPGYTVTARVIINTLADVLLVPLEAISEEDNETYVYRVSETAPGQGTIERITIEILDRNATVAAVKAAALTAADLIAVINLDELQPGTAVSYEPLEGKP
jgi:RND family efflux transporter MFP subunit